MKRLLLAATISAALCYAPTFAHHASQGIVDDEIYQMIDDLVADTPHASMDLVDGVITMPTVVSMERAIDDGLLTYLSMLDEDVQVVITFNDDRSVTMDIIR